MAKTKNTVIEYRNYYLAPHFPVLLLSGDYWKISDVPSGRLHFHNCLEIGICHSESGTLEFFDKKLPFQAGDVTVIPKNIPHTTYSSPGQESRWSYLFFDPQELFRNILPATWRNIDLCGGYGLDLQRIFNRDEYPYLYGLALAILKELEEQKPSYQLSAKGLLLSLYIELRRIQSASRYGGGAEGVFPEKEDSQETDNALVIAPALDYIEKNYAQLVQHGGFGIHGL